MKTHPESWFTSKVGERIYPTYSDFDKSTFPTLAAKYEKSGVFIKDEAQAIFLFESQEKSGTRYSDRKEALV